MLTCTIEIKSLSGPNKFDCVVIVYKSDELLKILIIKAKFYLTDKFKQLELVKNTVKNWSNTMYTFVVLGYWIQEQPSVLFRFRDHAQLGARIPHNE